jgi:2-alkenal reductase
MNKTKTLLLVFIVMAVAALGCVISPIVFSQQIEAEIPVDGEPQSPEVIIQVSGDLPSLYREINPGVVAIRALSETGGGLGTGFVWDSEGHIVTNYHVVESATDLEVDFPSGFKTRAEVLGVDSDSDLAVLELKQLPDELTVLPLGSNENLAVGQTVIAIGNPQGLNGTMTQGIISALGRTLDSLHFAPSGGAFATGNIIQTDAAINPGNSGGPLVNLNGEVIGINSSIRTSSIDMAGQPINSGLGFAISVDTAKNVIPDLIENGFHDSPYVGIQVLSEVSLFAQEELELPRSTGVYILEVSPDSPADAAGLIDEDLIISIDGLEVNDFAEFMGYLLTYKKPGDGVEIIALRDGEEMSFDLILGKRP